MLSFLDIDRVVFTFINQQLSNPVFDYVMPLITSLKFWLPIYVVSIGLMVWKGGSTGRWCALILMLSVGCSDVVNSRVLKPLFSRDRPFVNDVSARVLSPTAGGWSFPSTHAANNFAAAVVLTSFYRRKRLIWYFIASGVSFSRIYVGVHFPLDVIAGAAVGSSVSFILLTTYRVTRKRFSEQG